jgi:nucleoside-diphosphate-sugar epimerase
MRIFVAGATGAIGRRLVPQLIGGGHQVVGTYRSATERAGLLRAAGATMIELDLLDAPAVRQAVLGAEPDAIVHEATALAGASFGRKLDKTFAPTNQLRTAGTDALLAAAREAGIERFVAQSFAPYRYARQGGMVKAEDDPLDPNPPAGALETNAAMTHVDEAVTAFGGIALRYGGFYGDPDDQLVQMVRKRRYPIIGDGAGFSSWIHLDDAATATVLALGHQGPAIYNIVDDEPAATTEWLPVLAQALGARPPRHVPAWLAGIIAGRDSVNGMLEARGASNANARRELSWVLRYPTWRTGFRAAHPAGASAGRKLSAR